MVLTRVLSKETVGAMRNTGHPVGPCVAVSSPSSSPDSLSTKKRSLGRFISRQLCCLKLPHVTGKKLRKFLKRCQRRLKGSDVSSDEEVIDGGESEERGLTDTSDDEIEEGESEERSLIDTSDDEIDEAEREQLSVTDTSDDKTEDVTTRKHLVVYDPYTATEISEHQKWYCDQPSLPTTLDNGWIFSRETSQYSYHLNGSHHIESSLINHALLGITFYQFALETGDKFKGNVAVRDPHINNWLCGMLSMGNRLQWTTLGRHKAPSSTDEAMDIIKFTYGLKDLSCRDVFSERKSQTLHITGNAVDGTKEEDMLRNHILKLDPYKNESLLFCQDNKFIVFLPTKDNNIILVDGQSHTHMNGGALILKSKLREADVDDMLMEYYNYCVRPKPATTIGQAFLLSCPPHYRPCEIPL